jgi:hypothetical protein
MIKDSKIIFKNNNLGWNLLLLNNNSKILKLSMMIVLAKELYLLLKNRKLHKYLRPKKSLFQLLQVKEYLWKFKNAKN